MLLGEYRRRHEHGALPAVHGAFERRAHGDLRLAVAHVAAEQTVHYPVRLHIRLYLGDALELIGRFGMGEARLELRLPVIVGGEGVALYAAPLAVQRDQVERELLRALARFGDRPLPLAGAQAGELRLRLVPADVFLHPVELIRGNVELVARKVNELDIIAGLLVDGKRFYAREAAYAVRLVHDEIARLKLRKRKPGALFHGALFDPRLGAVYLVFRYRRELNIRIIEALGDRFADYDELPRDYIPLERRHGGHVETEVLERIGEPLHMLAGEKQHRVPLLPPADYIVAQELAPPHVARRGARFKAEQPL